MLRPKLVITRYGISAQLWQTYGLPHTVLTVWWRRPWKICRYFWRGRLIRKNKSDALLAKALPAKPVQKQPMYIVAGNRGQAELWARELGYTPKEWRYIDQNSCRGIQTDVIFLVGTYYARKDWPELQVALEPTGAELVLAEEMVPVPAGSWQYGDTIRHSTIDADYHTLDYDGWRPATVKEIADYFDRGGDMLARGTGPRHPERAWLID